MDVAVYSKKVYFKYSGNETPVLDHLDICVERGVIYGLLGPSGCGKTTLLRCIVGRLKPKSGELRVFNKAPGEPGFFIPGRGVGYVPQDTALYTEMTAEENLTYFGTLFNLPRSDIAERMESLLSLLEIPRGANLVNKLSGGQKRRLSFATALIHKPPLLILDEPTVGVDPILRKTIWKYLKRLTEDEGVTVMITTHHVEEARQANVLGLMRNGHLLAEGSPETLLSHYQATTLEEVFLKLCQRDQDDSEPNQNEIRDSQKHDIPIGMEMPLLEPFPKLHSHPGSMEPASLQGFVTAPSIQSAESYKRHSKNYKKCVEESMKRILALLWKDYIKLKRNVMITAVTLLIPFLQVIMFGLAVGRELHGLPIGLVNMETDGSIGQDFLNSLSNETFKKRYFGDLESAMEAARNTETWGVVYINPSFSECLMNRLSEGIEVSDETMTCSHIHLHLDMSDYQVSVTIRMKIMSQFQNYVASLLTDLHMNPKMADPVVVLGESVYGSENATFLEFVSPGMAIGFGYMAALTMSIMSILTEKKLGVYDRLLVAGVTSEEVISSTMIHMFVIVLLQNVSSMICIVYVLKVPIIGSFFAAFTCCVISGVSGVAFGLFISAVSDEENAAVMLALGMFFPITILSGILWPLEGMPYWLQYISYATPITLSCMTFRSIMTRGWCLTDYWMGPVVTTAWTLFFMTVVVIVLNCKRKKS